MSNDNTLPEELIRRIKQEAIHYCRDEANDTSREDCSYCAQDYIAGATEYAQWKVKCIEAMRFLTQLMTYHRTFNNPPTSLINEIKTFLDGTK